MIKGKNQFLPKGTTLFLYTSNFMRTRGSFLAQNLRTN